MKKVLMFLIVLLVLSYGQALSATPGSIGWAKTLPDDTVLPKPIIGVVSTIVSDPLMGGYASYIEDVNRCSGILVDSQGVTGQIVQVTGTIKSKLSGERYISGSILLPTGSGQLVLPLGMNNNFVSSKSGLSTDGLMALAWGSVTGSGYDDYGNPYLYLDDGSGLVDGTTDGMGNQNKGLRVKTYYADQFQVGDYLSIMGPIGKDASSDGTKSFKVVQECLTFPTLSVPVAYAIGGNSQIYITWDGDPCAGAYRVYRSDAETGNYSVIGQSTAADLSWLDKPLPNGATYWYKVSSVSGNTEGQLSAPVSATTTASAPMVVINTLNVDADGVLDITFSCAPGTGGTPIPMVSLDIDGAELWDDSPSGIGNSWCFDTNELDNRVHTIGVKVISANSATGDRYLGYDKKSFVVNNDISNLFVSELTDNFTPTPFQATFGTDCNWTATVRQGTTVLGQQSGTGKEMDWTWDASTGYEGPAEIEVSYTPISGMSTNSANLTASAVSTKSKFATFWITRRDLLPRPGHYQWAAWYARDQMINAVGAWTWADYFFKNNFNVPLSSYSMQLTMPSQWDTVVLEDFAQIDEPAKISHVVWSGHGNFGLDNYNYHPNVLQANAWTANFVGQGDWWYGISPFRDYYDSGMKIKLTALGPRIGNRAAWRKVGNGRGRPEITQMNRRLKFAAVFGCWSTRGTMPLALGIPKKQIKGCRCVYLGFNNMLWAPAPANNFSYFMFDALKRAQTMGVAVNFASKAFAMETGEAAKGNPRLFGDPDLKIGRLE